MDTDGNLLLFSLLFIFLLLLGGFFTLGQSAIITLSDSKLKKMCDDGVKKALRVQVITKKPSRFKGTTEFGFLFCTILSVTCAFFLFYPLLTNAFTNAFSVPNGVDTFWTKAVSFLLVFLASLFLVLVVSKTIPYHLGCGKPERFAFGCAPGIRFFMCLFAPGVWLVQRVSFGLSKLFGVDPAKQSSAITEEEIRMMMDVGNEKGVIESSQMEMINNVFEFDDTTASDVMTHRTNIVAVPRTARISDVVYLAVNEGFSRIPVYDEDIDDIVGAVYVKDLLVLVNCETSNDFSVEDFIRPVLYVPDSAKLPELFRQLSAKKAHLAVVIDEYGGTSGLLTMEDLVEAIVGNIQDEYDDEEDDIIKLDDTTFTFDGGVDLEDLSKTLGITFEETDDYDTVSGLIIHTLGRIPAPNEKICVTINGVEFTVLLVEDRRIARVKAVRPLPKTQTESDEKTKD